jgi:hypothetical protein
LPKDLLQTRKRAGIGKEEELKKSSTTSMKIQIGHTRERSSVAVFGVHPPPPQRKQSESLRDPGETTTNNHKTHEFRSVFFFFFFGVGFAIL